MEIASSPTKAQQLEDVLVREIVTGQLPDGTKLPPERELAERFNVAVGTLRKALVKLETKGLLKRVQGSGNYIQAQPLVDSVYAFFRLRLNRGGGVPSAAVLDVCKTKKPADARYFGESREGFRIRRLRSIADTPIALEEIWLDGRFEEKFDRDKLNNSMYLFYKDVLNLTIIRIEDWVGLDHVPEWTPNGFGLVTGDLSGYVTRVGTDQTNQPVEFSRTWFNPDRVHYHSVIS